MATMTAAKQPPPAPGSGDRRYWEQHARNYDRSLRVLAKPMPRMLELCAAAVWGAGRVLEVAAGTGLVTMAIAPAVGQLVATDYAAAMVAMLETRVEAAGLTNVRCEQADLYALPYGSGTFDSVIAANVLHLVPDLPRALAALRKVLKPGGQLIVPTFSHDETWVSRVTSRALALTGFPGHRRFTASGLRASLEQVQLRVEQLEVLPGLIPITFVRGTFP